MCRITPGCLYRDSLTLKETFNKMEIKIDSENESQLK